jgi:hypothetical protein
MHNQINDEAVSIREAAIEREIIWLGVMRLMKPNLEYSRRMNRLMAEAYELTKNPKYLL